MKIAIKEPGKELQLVEVTEKYRTDCVKHFTGKKNRAEFVRLNDNGTFCMGLNEDGLLLDLPVNFLFETTNPHYPIQKAVGTVVFVRHKYVNVVFEEVCDYEIEDLREEDLVHISAMLHKQYQDILQSQFKDYGKNCSFFIPM